MPSTSTATKVLIALIAIELSGIFPVMAQRRPSMKLVLPIPFGPDRMLIRAGITSKSLMPLKSFRFILLIFTAVVESATTAEELEAAI